MDDRNKKIDNNRNSQSFEFNNYDGFSSSSSQSKSKIITVVGHTNVIDFKNTRITPVRKKFSYVTSTERFDIIDEQDEVIEDNQNYVESADNYSYKYDDMDTFNNQEVESSNIQYSDINSNNRYFDAEENKRWDTNSSLQTNTDTEWAFGYKTPESDIDDYWEDQTTNTEWAFGHKNPESDIDDYWEEEGWEDQTTNTEWAFGHKNPESDIDDYWDNEDTDTEWAFGHKNPEVLSKEYDDQWDEEISEPEEVYENVESTISENENNFNIRNDEVYDEYESSYYEQPNEVYQEPVFGVNQQQVINNFSNTQIVENTFNSQQDTFIHFVNNLPNISEATKNAFRILNIRFTECVQKLASVKNKYARYNLPKDFQPDFKTIRNVNEADIWQIKYEFKNWVDKNRVNFGDERLIYNIDEYIRRITEEYQKLVLISNSLDMSNNKTS